MRIALLFVSVLLGLALNSGAFGAAWAAHAPYVGLKRLGKTEPTVTAIIDGDTVELSDKRQVRLVGIQAPKLPLGRRGFMIWPLAEEAKAELGNILLGKKVILWSGGQSLDRHNRTLAHITLAGTEVWAQQEMLRRGFARVYTFADNRAAAAPLYEAEAQARHAKSGIWQKSFYAIQLAGNVVQRSGFELVEGTVVSVSHTHSFTYLNFGADWKTDFTVRIAPKNRRNFGNTQTLGKAWLDELRGQQVRVRGWVFERGGKMIEISHAEEIELIKPVYGQ